MSSSIRLDNNNENDDDDGGCGEEWQVIVDEKQNKEESSSSRELKQPPPQVPPFAHIDPKDVEEAFFDLATIRRCLKEARRPETNYSTILPVTICGRRDVTAGEYIFKYYRYKKLKNHPM